MTPLMLQDDLVEEIKKLFAESLFKNPQGELVPINVFPQSIPVEESDDDADPIPYIIVRLTKGDDSGERDSNNTVSVVIIAGLCDFEKDAQGHRGLLNIISTIYERFQKNPSLNNKYVHTGHFKWAIQDDGYYPYYFGAAEMSFNIPAIRREDKFA